MINDRNSYKCRKLREPWTLLHCYLTKFHDNGLMILIVHKIIEKFMPEIQFWLVRSFLLSCFIHSLSLLVNYPAFRPFKVIKHVFLMVSPFIETEKLIIKSNISLKMSPTGLITLLVHSFDQRKKQQKLLLVFNRLFWKSSTLCLGIDGLYRLQEWIGIRTVFEVVQSCYFHIAWSESFLYRHGDIMKNNRTWGMQDIANTGKYALNRNIS